MNWMKTWGKRIILFLAVNMVIMVTINLVLNLLGVQPYLQANSINYTSLLIFCALWGFVGSFISLLLSKVMAKWMMGVKVIDDSVRDPRMRALVQKVHYLSRRAGLTKMPEVGYYESPDLNAFATGPTKSNSLVAVSTGLLDRMSENEVDGVLAHEVAHIANGDMVTMTLLQGVVNTFVMFFARIAGFALSQAVDEEKRPIVRMIANIVFEIIFGIIGMMIVAGFSRYREYRADEGGARLGGKANMIAALEALQRNYGAQEQVADESATVAAFKISGKKSKFLGLMSTHPDLTDRIAALRKAAVA